MALTKGYKAGDNMEDIKNADTERYTLTGAPRKNNAGRKRMTPANKKQCYTIAMTTTEHDHLVTLANELTDGSASALIVALVEKEYNKRV